jgi:RNA polymerase sigma-70 factor, ECF subfamily
MRAVQVAPTPPDPSASDGELVERARAGDRAAFGELIRRHQRRVWLVCRQYVGPDEAEVATQDSLVKAYSRLAAFDGHAAFSTWLTRIAINTCLDQLRRQRRQGLRVEADAEEGEAPLERLPDSSADPERRAMQRQAVLRLRSCEARLPAQQREVFRLRFYAELPLQEIAESLAVSIGTVKTQLHRAVHRLRQELEGVR